MTDDTRTPDLSGIIPALMDWSFKRFITISLVKFMYILGIIGLAVSIVFSIFAGLAGGITSGLTSVIMGVIAFALGVLWLRVCLEMVVVVFRIAQNTTVLARHARGEPLDDSAGDLSGPTGD